RTPAAGPHVGRAPYTVGPEPQGGPWERLPHDVRPQPTVSDACGQWRDEGPWATLGEAWRERPRVAAGCTRPPPAASLGRPSGQTTERGDDGGKKSHGRKRPLWVETLGVWWAVLLTHAGLDEGGGSAPARAPPPSHYPRLVTIVAEQPSPHHALGAWRAAP